MSMEKLSRKLVTLDLFLSGMGNLVQNVSKRYLVPVTNIGKFSILAEAIKAKKSCEEENIRKIRTD